jgi:hypothetical protein
MFNFIKNALQGRSQINSEADRKLIDQMIRGDKPFDIIDNASNLIGNFMDLQDSRDGITKSILHASQKTIDEIGFKGKFLAMFDLNATATLREAAIASEKFADMLYTDKDKKMSLMSDSFSLIAVICYGRIGKYKGNESNTKIYEMSAQLVGAVMAAEG